MLKFNAIKYQNRDLGLSLKEDTLPVKVENGKFILPTENDILVKVHAAALNPIDLLVKNSLLPWIFKGDKGLGSDYAGEVAAIGSGAVALTGFSVGDRISGLYQVFLGPGATSEYILINPAEDTGRSARKIPDHLSYQEGAAYPLVGATAQMMIDTVVKGNSFKNVLVLGAGTAVGRYSVQLAKNVYGSENVVVTCSGRTEKTIKELGATAVIDYTKQKSILGPVLEKVKEIGKFDVILDCCGNADLFPEITSILKDNKEFGSYITIVGDRKVSFKESLTSMLLGNYIVAWRALKCKFGFLPYFYAQTMLSPSVPWPENFVKNLADGKLKVFIDSEYPIADTAKAVERLESNKATGKVIVNVI